jgi:hypothetical protein
VSSRGFNTKEKNSPRFASAFSIIDTYVLGIPQHDWCDNPSLITSIRSAYDRARYDRKKSAGYGVARIAAAGMLYGGGRGKPLAE